MFDLDDPLAVGASMPGADGLAELIVSARDARQQAECDLFILAGLWADAHDAASGLAGADRCRCLGAEGTPQVTEFAHDELGTLLHVSGQTAAELMAGAIDVRHRLPETWDRVRTGTIRPYMARHVAQATRHLDGRAALVVDDTLTPHWGILPWRRLRILIEATVIDVDPDAADARTRAAERFVRAGQTNEHGLKLLVAKAVAGDVIFFLAMVNRIADTLAADGDPDPIEVRRSKAIGILANPALALHLLVTHATPDHHTASADVGTDTATSPHAATNSDIGTGVAVRAATGPEPDAGDDTTAPSPTPASTAGPTRPADPQPLPGHAGPDEPATETQPPETQPPQTQPRSPRPSPDQTRRTTGHTEKGHTETGRPPDHGATADSDAQSGSDPTEPGPSNTRHTETDWPRPSGPPHSNRSDHSGPGADDPGPANPCRDDPGRHDPGWDDARRDEAGHDDPGWDVAGRDDPPPTDPEGDGHRSLPFPGNGDSRAPDWLTAIDYRKLRPTTVLHIHITDRALIGGEGCPHTARVEDVGPITLTQVRGFLDNPFQQIRVQPVLDPARTAPADSYEIPMRLREAARLRHLADTFPYGTRDTRSMDLDHTIPWETGGPTAVENLSPLTRHHHRAKTHGGWGKRQPDPDTIVWRSPHGWIYLVTPHGILDLGHTTYAHDVWDAARPDRANRGDGNQRTGSRATEERATGNPPIPNQSTGKRPIGNRPASDPTGPDRDGVELAS